MEYEKKQIRKILLATLTSLCSNTLKFKNQLNIEGLFGITIDKDQVLLININEEVINDFTDCDKPTINKPNAGINEIPSNKFDENSLNNKNVIIQKDENTSSPCTSKVLKEDISNKDSDSNEPYSEVLKTVKLIQKADGQVEQSSQVAWKTVDAEGQVVQHKTYETVKTLNNTDVISENFEEDQNLNVIYEEPVQYNAEADYTSNLYSEENGEFEYESFIEGEEEEQIFEEDYAYDNVRIGSKAYEHSGRNFNVPHQIKSELKHNNREKPAPKRRKRKQAFEFDEHAGQWEQPINNNYQQNKASKKMKSEEIYPKSSQQFRHTNPNKAFTPQSNLSPPYNFNQGTSNTIPQKNSQMNNTLRPNNPMPRQSNPQVHLPKLNQQSGPSQNTNARISSMLEMAVQLILNKKLTIAKACTLYGIPKQLLLKRLKGAQI